MSLTHIVTAVPRHPLGALTALDSPQGAWCQSFWGKGCVVGVEWAVTSPMLGATWSVEGGIRSPGLVSAAPKAWQPLSHISSLQRGLKSGASVIPCYKCSEFPPAGPVCLPLDQAQRPSAVMVALNCVHSGAGQAAGHGACVSRGRQVSGARPEDRLLPSSHGMGRPDVGKCEEGAWHVTNE